MALLSVVAREGRLRPFSWILLYFWRLGFCCVSCVPRLIYYSPRVFLCEVVYSFFPGCISWVCNAYVKVDLTRGFRSWVLSFSEIVLFRGVRFLRGSAIFVLLLVCCIDDFCCRDMLIFAQGLFLLCLLLFDCMDVVGCWAPFFLSG